MALCTKGKQLNKNKTLSRYKKFNKVRLIESRAFVYRAQDSSKMSCLSHLTYCWRKYNINIEKYIFLPPPFCLRRRNWQLFSNFKLKAPNLLWSVLHLRNVFWLLKLFMQIKKILSVGITYLRRPSITRLVQKNYHDVAFRSPEDSATWISSSLVRSYF